MKKRKIIFALFLAAVLTLTGISPSFAAEDYPPNVWVEFGSRRLHIDISEDDYNLIVKSIESNFKKSLSRMDMTAEEAADLMEDFGRDMVIMPLDGSWYSSSWFITLGSIWMDHFEDVLTLKDASDEIIDNLKADYQWLYNAELTSTYETEDNIWFYTEVPSDRNKFCEYVSVWNGYIITYELLYFSDTAYEKGKAEMEKIMEKTILTKAKEPEEGGMRKYSLENDLVSISLSDGEYDIFTENNEDNQLSLRRQGYTLEEMDKIMADSGCLLQAVKAGEDFDGSSLSVKVKIERGGYEKVGNLKSLGELAQYLLADTIAGTLEGSAGECELYQTDQADFFFFDLEREAIYESIYATVADGSVIYIIMEKKDAPLTDEEKEELKEIVDMAEFIG